MDISVGNKEENVKKTDKKPAGKGKKDDKKSKPPAGLPEMRSRAKSTVVNTFEQKKGPQKKELKPIETIGNDRFKNLLSMFDKKPENKEAREDTGPKKLDMSKYAFGQSNTDSQDNNGPKKSSEMADSIKKRMEALLNNNKSGGKSGSYVDPVLEQRRKQKELEAEDEEDEDYEEESEENLHISEDEDEHDKEQSDKEENDDKEENEEKDDNEEKEDDKENEVDKEENDENNKVDIEAKQEDNKDNEDFLVDQKKESEKKEEHKVSVEEDEI